MMKNGISQRIMARVWGLAMLGLALPQSPAQADIYLVTTTTMVRDMVQAVAGKGAVVEGLMGPGVDPHLYKPVASDMARLRKADGVFYSGLLLEGKMEHLFKKMQRRGDPVFGVADSLESKHLLKPAGFEGHYDPHVWGDVLLWRTCVPEVVKGLCMVDPAKAVTYRSNGQRYMKALQELDEWVKQRVELVPESSRILVTSHDAFNYFGRAYGFRVVAVQGISTVTEAGLADIVKMVDFIKDQRVKAIFVESSVNPAAIKRISEDAGVRVGGSLFSDAMGTPGRMHGIGIARYDEGTFSGMIKHNVNTIVEALK